MASSSEAAQEAPEQMEDEEIITDMATAVFAKHKGYLIFLLYWFYCTFVPWSEHCQAHHFGRRQMKST